MTLMHIRVELGALRSELAAKRAEGPDSDHAEFNDDTTMRCKACQGNTLPRKKHAHS